MGIIADVYKHADGDCSNGGLSSLFDKVTIVNVDGPFEPDDDRPAVLLVAGNRPGTVKCVVAVENPVGSGDYWEFNGGSKVGPTFGGCFVATSDSRFREATAFFHNGGVDAVPLHDRFETQSEYDALSR
jgi:hypothetical protein